MMKFLLCLFLLVITASGSPAFAVDDDSVRGVIGGQDKKLPPPTAEQLEEAFQVSDSCKAYGITNTYYDCDCVGLKFLEGRQRQGDKASAFWLKEEAQRKCPNTTDMAGMIYTRCLSWAPLERGYDYEPFCSCYGSEFAKIYAKNPSENQLVREAQMTVALINCKANSVNEEKQDMDRMVEKLKAEGTYDALLPGAAIINKPPMPK